MCRARVKINVFDEFYSNADKSWNRKWNSLQARYKRVDMGEMVSRSIPRVPSLYNFRNSSFHSKSKWKDKMIGVSFGIFLCFEVEQMSLRKRKVIVTCANKSHFYEYCWVIVVYRILRISLLAKTVHVFGYLSTPSTPSTHISINDNSLH